MTPSCREDLAAFPSRDWWRRSEPGPGRGAWRCPEDSQPRIGLEARQTILGALEAPGAALVLVGLLRRWGSPPAFLPPPPEDEEPGRIPDRDPR
ncbi:hypothetical protein NDU88_011019 [Pleurodeles waltl]|uniref:Uncharacterized protein n=1 Tax=Pleurodeles waltl TaxID=8319 RepID=A0AAV7QZ73_PLEWA|nr:hypothetical protein NDU88_011019 [Pleurodeles waltl]